MTATPPTVRPSGRAGWAVVAGAGVAAAGVALYALTVLSPATGTAITGTTVAATLGHFIAALAGAGCLSGLVLVLVTARPDDHGVLDPMAFRAHLTVERMSVLWCASALVMVVVQAAADAGVSAARLLAGGGLTAAVGASETARAWIAVALFAAVIAVFSRLTVRWEWHVPLAIPAVLGVMAVPVTGSAGQGPDHDYATSSVIVFAVAFSVWAGLRIVGAIAPAHSSVRRRAGLATLAAGSVALVYGVALIALRVGLHGLTSGYGLLAVVAVTAMAAGLIFRTGAVSPAIAIAALAALSILAVQTAPLLLSTQPSVWDVLLGYELPGAPTPLRLLTFWRFDALLGAAALVLATGYSLGVVRLRRRGDLWPAGRTVAWLTGCSALLFA
ncbi:MAG: cytochrome c oxidase assembly protein, partial [Mycobacterium sp.]